ncbi:MAG: hypothetical protein JWN39_2102 [Ilumatobacteraceae bacterium]|nr:hypothetical protein [Ilumatobacteraceae bacterium]
MVDISTSGTTEATDTDAPVDPPQRRPLPRAARLSRLVAAPTEPVTPAAELPIVSPEVAAFAPPQLGSSDIFTSTVARTPLDGPSAEDLAAAMLAPDASALPLPVEAPAAPAPVRLEAASPTKPAGPRPTVQLVELVPNTDSAPTAASAVTSAGEAGRAVVDTASGPVLFKPLNDVMAARSVILSAIGLVLCFFPVLSLAGLVMGLIAQRRIRHSQGQLLGIGSAKFGILLGVIGVVVGATADLVLLVGR